MATLTLGQHVVRLFSSGDPDRVALYSLRNISGNDIVDLTADFQIINRAVVITIEADLEAMPTKITATQLAIPSGPSFDIGFLLAWGSST